MSKVSTLVIAVLAFGAGVGTGYVQFSSPHTGQKSASDQPKISIEKQEIEIIATPPQPELSRVDSSAPTAPIKPLSEMPQAQTAGEPTPQALDQAQQKIAKLQQQLAENEQVILTLSKGADMNEQMQQTFEDQERDEVWAYETETKFNDFIYVAGLSDQIAVTNAHCKSTICTAEFVPLEGVEMEPREGWGQISDTLHAQPFWKQFRRSSSTSSNDRYEVWVERPLPQ